MVPVVSEDLLGEAALPTRDSYEWFTETKEKRAPNWENEVTLKTVEMLSEYAPIDYIERISPTPLLMIVAVILGGRLFGLPGALLALPGTTVLVVLGRWFWDFYRETDVYRTKTVEREEASADQPRAAGGRRRRVT